MIFKGKGVDPQALLPERQENRKQSRLIISQELIFDLKYRKVRKLIQRGQPKRGIFTRNSGGSLEGILFIRVCILGPFWLFGYLGSDSWTAMTPLRYVIQNLLHYRFWKRFSPIDEELAPFGILETRIQLFFLGVKVGILGGDKFGIFCLEGNSFCSPIC